MPSVLIKNARIVTMNKNREVLEGDLLVEGDRIACIGHGPFKAELEIDAKGGLLIPGLVQAHIHLCQTLFRGRADDLELMTWLKKRIWPLEGAHDEESVYYSALLGIGELFACGTTSIIDMETVHNTESAFLAISETGMRAISGKCMMDWGGDVPQTMLESTDASLQESSDLCEKWNGSCNGRISYAFAPRFAVSCSHELLKSVGELSRLYGVRIHSHASENTGEMRLAALIHKPKHGPTTMPAKTVFEMATLHGAQAMGLSQSIGSLEAGKKADLVLVNLSGIHCIPVMGTDVYAQLVYQAKACDVALTMVEGQIVYQDGVLKTIDEADCKLKCEKLIGRICNKAGIV